ncbi:MAG TPA: EAL domain-containing protein [Chroococcidiopsis sp.]
MKPESAEFNAQYGSSLNPGLSSTLMSNVAISEDLAFILEQLNLAIALFDRNQMLVHHSPALQQLWQLPLDWLCARPASPSLWEMLVQQGYWSASQQRAVRQAQTASHAKSLRLTQTNGVTLDIRFTTTPSGLRLMVVNPVAVHPVTAHPVTTQPIGMPALPEALMAVPSGDRHPIEQAFYHSEERFRSIVSNIPGVVFRCANDSQWTIAYVSDAIAELSGYPASDFIDNCVRPFSSIEHPDDQAAIRQIADDALASGNPYIIEFRIIHADGSIRWVLERGRGVYDGAGNLLYIDGVIVDITRQKETEDALRQAEEQYRSIYENAIEGIFQSTLDGHYVSVNPALAKIYGFASSDELVTQLTDIAHQLYVDPNRRAEFLSLMQEQGKVSQFESRIYRRDGTIIWIAENVQSVCDRDGNFLYYQGTVEDITARKFAEEQLFINAFHDFLTGLPNRALFMDRLQNALAHVYRRPNTLFAVLFIDLDRFKVINDSLGHLVGDQLLIHISQRLQRCVRVGDTVARLGGDEFAILLDDIQDINDAINVAERIQEQLTQPFQIQGHDIFTSASVGITLSRHHQTHEPYSNLEDLLRDADIAMYRAKYRGKARHEIFDSTMDLNALNQFQLETDLRRALDRQEFQLYYQPIVALPSGLLTGFEALLRWQHPDRGLLSPSDFIALAEDTGLIVPIGEWVIREACQQIRQWLTAGMIEDTATVNINLAGRQLSEPNLAARVQQILQETGVAAHTLCIEVAEGVIMEDIEAIAHNLHQLQQMGIHCCVDDFGVGYSSLSRLHSFPIDMLKIDRSFIKQLNTRSENWVIIKTILNLAASLHMRVTAEGVETVDQLLQLTSLGCNSAQGYLFSQPLDAGAIAALIRDRHGYLNDASPRRYPRTITSTP